MKAKYHFNQLVRLKGTAQLFRVKSFLLAPGVESDVKYDLYEVGPAGSKTGKVESHYQKELTHYPFAAKGKEKFPG